MEVILWYLYITPTRSIEILRNERVLDYASNLSLKRDKANSNQTHDESINNSQNEGELNHHDCDRGFEIAFN